MPGEFVAKKTITVQLTLDVMEKFKELCILLELPKTKLIEKLIVEAYRDLSGE